MPKRYFKEHEAFLANYPFTNMRDEAAFNQEFKMYAQRETTRLLNAAKQDREEARTKAAEAQERYDALQYQADKLADDLTEHRITFDEVKPLRQAILREQRLLGGLIDGLESQYKRANEIEEDPLGYYDSAIRRFPSMFNTLPDWSI